MELPLARRRCPSFLEIAGFEADDLADDLPRAFIHSHAERCVRCRGTISEIRAARRELFSMPTPEQDRMRVAGEIALMIARGLERQLHERALLAMRRSPALLTSEAG